jgi:hypothetical protein
MQLGFDFAQTWCGTEGQFARRGSVFGLCVCVCVRVVRGEVGSFEKVPVEYTDYSINALAKRTRILRWP